MKVKTILLGAAACAVLSTPAFARETTEQRLERMEKIIQEQQQEISDLKAQQAVAPAPTPAPAEEVAEQPASQSDVEALQNQVYEQAAANKSGWWNNTKISGRMYYDITDVNGVSRPNSNSSSHTYDASNGTNFDIKRFYLGVDHTFNDVFSANLTTDFTYDNGSGGPSASQLYIKKAYLQAKLDDALIFRLGSADLPWVPFVEDVYGYRYVENTLIDRTKYGTSADWGVHMLGSFMNNLFSYQISAIDGMGYKKAPTNGSSPSNRSEGIDVEGRVSMNYDGFILALGGYHGQLGKDLAKTSPSSPDSTFRTANRFDALAAYQMDAVRFGVEYFYTDNWNTVASSSSKDDARGVSVFGSYQFDPQWGIFGRYDWVNPTTTVIATSAQTDVKDKYFNVGISYSPTKIVDFALVYKHEVANDGSLATSNGTIGGALDGTYNELGLWGQLRW